MSIDAKDTLNKLLAGNDLAEAEAGDLMRLLADEDLAPAMSAALLIATRCAPSIFESGKIGPALCPTWPEVSSAHR